MTGLEWAAILVGLAASIVTVLGGGVKAVGWLVGRRERGPEEEDDEHSGPDVDHESGIGQVSTERATNLALPAGTFRGRDADVAELSRRVLHEECRLVTVVGPGGQGKTRLALEFARLVADRFPGGVWVANLVEARTETGIAFAVAEALGEELRNDDTGDTSAIVQRLRNRGRFLLVLDNFEHVVDLAGETVGAWLRRLPHASMVVTSRVRLGLDEEVVHPLDPLPPAAASELFAEEARNARRDFALGPGNAAAVRRICEEVSCRPLLIKLAARRVRTFTAEEIAEQLDEKLRFSGGRRTGDPRHETGHATIDWSVQLLQPWERHALLQLSVFREGCDLRAARKVIDLEAFPAAPSIEDVLGVLVDWHLVLSAARDDRVRFDLDPPVRDYVSREWEAATSVADAHALEDRWANHYLGIDRAVPGRAEKEVLDELRADFENLLGIQEVFLERGDARTASRAILTVARLLEVRGPARLRLPRLRASAEAFRDRSDPLLGNVLVELSRAAWARGRWDLAGSAVGEAVELARAAGDALLLAGALLQQGLMWKDRGHLRRAVRTLEEAGGLFEARGDGVRRAVSITHAAAALERLGDLDGCLERLDEAEALLEGLSADRQLGLIYNRRGLAYWHHGEPAEALRCMETAERHSKAAENEAWIPAHRTNRGLILTDLGRFETALSLFEATRRAHVDSGSEAWEAVNQGGWGRALVLRNAPGSDDLDRGVAYLREAEQAAREVGYPESIAMHVGDLARAFILRDDRAAARSCIEEAVRLERRMEAVRDHRYFSHVVTLARCLDPADDPLRFWESVEVARRLVVILDLPTKRAVPTIQEDLAHLAVLREAWRGSPHGGPDVAGEAAPPVSGHRLPLDQRALVRLLESVHEGRPRSTVPYPWDGFEEALAARGEGGVLLLGYGSLMHPDSLRRTFPALEPGGMRPALGFGIVRLLDYDMPDEVRIRSSYRAAAGSVERALFNARFTGSIADHANGMLVEIPVEEVVELRAREVGYDLHPIVCVPWDHPDAHPLPAWALGCAGRSWNGKPLSNPALAPHRDYYDLCREGAASVSDGFLEFFRQTAFLADGVTPVGAWEEHGRGHA